jgi:hypothetical protein
MVNHTERRNIGAGATNLGRPSWITAELIDHTISVWQPYYEYPLSLEDAVSMIQDVGRLVNVLSCVKDVKGSSQ